MFVAIFINVQIGTTPMKRILIMMKGMWKLLIWFKKWSYHKGKNYMQPQLLVLMTTQVKEQPSPPPPLLSIIEVKNNDDPFEENDEV